CVVAAGPNARFGNVHQPQNRRPARRHASWASSHDRHVVDQRAIDAAPQRLLTFLVFVSSHSKTWLRTSRGQAPASSERGRGNGHTCAAPATGRNGSERSRPYNAAGLANLGHRARAAEDHTGIARRRKKRGQGRLLHFRGVTGGGKGGQGV